MTPTVREPPVVDLHSDEYVADPLRAIDEWRRRSWIARSERGYEVFSHRGVEAGYQNTGLVTAVGKFLADMGIDVDTMAGGGGNLQNNEGPSHTRLRRVVSRWFTPRKVDELRPRVRALAGSRLDALGDEGDFMSTVASRIPGPVFCWMLGAPEEEGDHLFALSAVLLQAFEGNLEHADEILAAAVEMRELVDGLIEAKRRAPTDDLLSIMLAATDDGDLTIDDVHSLSFEMLSASTDNTAHSAGLAVHVLSQHPDQYRRVHEQPELVPRTVEECLRIEPRVRYDPHYTHEGTTLLDAEIPAESIVYLHNAAANTDPDVYPDPHRFDVTRAHDRPQMNFGIGRHFCLGAALARMELSEIVGALARRWSELEPAGDAEIDRFLGAAVGSLPIRGTR